MAANVDIIIRAQNQASGVISQVQRDLGGLERVASTASQGFGGLQRAVGAGMMVAAGAATAGIAALTAGLAKSVNTAADFESQMNVLGVAARSSGTAVEQLSAAAIQVGSDTELVGVSASEAAAAMTNFYKAGLSTTDIFSDLQGYLGGTASLSGALRAAVDLAAASELDLATASDTVAVAMATFGLGAEDATRISNVLVQAADASLASVGGLADGLNNIGPVAASMGIGLEDVSTALAILSTRGIQGSEAGTAMKSMLLNMQRPTKAVRDALDELGVSLFNTDGTMRGLPEIIGSLEQAMSGLTEEQRNQYATTIAGSYGLAAFQTLVGEGAGGWNDMATAIGKAATAQQVAEARTKGFRAAMEQMQGALESLMISVGTPLLQIFLTPLAQGITEVINRITALAPSVTEVEAAFTAFLATGQAFIATIMGVITPVTDAIGSFISWKDILIVLAGVAASIVIPALVGIVAAVAPVLGVFAALVAGVALVRTAWERNWGGIQERVAAAVEAIGGVLTTLGEYFRFVVEDGDYLNDWLMNLPEWMQPAVEWLGKLTAAIVALATGGSFSEFTDKLGELTGIDISGWAETFGAAWETIKSAVSGGVTAVGTALGEAKTAFDGFFSSDAWATASDGISAAFGNIGTAIGDAMAGDIDFDTLQSTVITELGGIGTAISELFQSEAFTSLSSELSTAFGLDAVSAAIAPQVEAIKAALQPLIDFLTPAFERIGETVSDLGTYFASIGTQVEPVKAAAGELVAAFVPLAESIAGLFSGGDGGSPSVAASILAGALSLVLNVINGLALAIEPLVSGVLAELATVLSGLATIVGGLTTAISGMISGDTAAAWEGLGTAAGGVAEILTGTLSNALGVISGLLDALGATITGTLSDWGFTAAAEQVQGVIDKVTMLIETLAGIASGEIAIGMVMPEWINSLFAWTWPTFEMPEWLTTLSSLTFPEWTTPEWITSLAVWQWPEWTMPAWVTVLTFWQWPTAELPAWVDKLLAWAWPGLPAAPSWVTTLMAWVWPVLAPVQWVADLVAWAWPSIPGSDWIGSLMAWQWPTLPGAGWIGNLLDWDWPSFPSAPSWLPDWLGGGSQPAPSGGIPGSASGTAFFRGGLTWVGEAGRELVQLPRGSRIYNNRESERMIEQAPQVIVYATVTNDVDMEMLAWRVVDLIGARA